VGTLLYTALAALFIWTGIGAVKTRRWVRPITLILAWTWLLAGLMGLILWLVMLPNLRQMIQATQPSEPPLDPGAYTAISLIASAFIVLAYVALPAAFIWFYHDRNVRATLEAFDPVPGWTDRCPLPVLGLSLSLWVGVALTLCALPYSLAPTSGLPLSAGFAVVLILAHAAAMAWLAHATYRLRMAGWWGTTIFTIVVLVESIVAALRVDLADLYRSVGIPDDQLDVLRSYGRSISLVMVFSTALLGLALLGFMLYMRRYFPGPPPEPPVGRG